MAAGATLTFGDRGGRRSGHLIGRRFAMGRQGFSIFGQKKMGVHPGSLHAFFALRGITAGVVCVPANRWPGARIAQGATVWRRCLAAR